MSPVVHPDEHSVWSFIYQRVAEHGKFKRTLIAVSVQKHASQFTATVWIGQEPDHEMVQYLYQLEDELREQDILCSIIVKTDKELPFGGKYPLRTAKGEFVYRYYRTEILKDEDFVYVFSLSQGAATYRFRVSLTGTLASMLRGRGLFEENRILNVYLDEIKRWIEEKELSADRLNEIMLNSRDVAKFSGR